MTIELNRLEPTSIRLRRRDREILQRAAQQSEMRFTDFIRRAALKVAREQIGAPDRPILEPYP